jgi:hypothetical protein
MADYFTHVVVQPTIPHDDMTPLERLILPLVFDSDEEKDGIYFYSETGPADNIILDRDDLEKALTASKCESSLNDTIAEQLAARAPGDSIIEPDLSGGSTDFIFQDIVRRSATLKYVTIVAAFTCSKMRSDGFGGAATLITADAILGKSTTDILEDFLTETGLDQPDDLLTPSTDGRHA